METPVEISFKNTDQSDAIEARVREKVAKLEQYFGRITSCSVVIEAPHHRHNKGNQYHIRVKVHVPGKDLVVNRDPGDASAHEDIYVAIRDAFNAMTRQLEDHARVSRGDVKTH